MEWKDRRWTIRLSWVVIIATLAFFSARLYYRLTDDFSIAHMTHPMPYNPEWEIPPLTAKERATLHVILGQPFNYIGKGAQSYAFISRDGEYVIKFFKFKHLKPNWFVRTLPDISLFDDYKAMKRARKDRLIDSVFNGYRLAYDVHREESGLVYIHLNMSGDLNESVTLYDKIGRKHELDLDSTVFVLQKTVKTTRDMIQEALEKRDLALAKRRLDRIIDLYLLEYSKGIYDRDHGLMHNTGFAGEKAIHLDVGKMSPEPRMAQKEFFKADLVKLSQRFESWLNANFPEYHEPLMGHWEKRINAAAGEKVSL